MRNCTLLTVFFLTVSTLPLPAGTLQIYGYGAGALSLVVDQYNANASVGDVLLYSDTASHDGSGRGSSMSMRARAAFGSLGMGFSNSAFCVAQGCGVENLDGSEAVRSSDSLEIGGLDAGFLRLDFLFEGTFTAYGPWPTRVETAYQMQYFHPGLTAQTSALLSAYGAITDIETFQPIVYSQQDIFVGGEFGEYLPQPNGAAWLGVSAGYVLIPFASGEVTIDQMLVGSWRCDGSPTASCVANADFYNSAKVGGAAVYDINMNLVPGATINSESGYDYTQRIAADGAEVPEPSTLAMALIGLAVFAPRRGMLACRAWLRCRNRRVSG